MSEPAIGLIGSLPIGVATVEVEDSGIGRAVRGGEEGRGVVLASWRGFFGVSLAAGWAASCGGSGERGVIARFSWMEFTTFSRSMGAMCLPRAWLVAESWRRRSGREDELERVVAVRALSAVESSEAMLEESSGTSSRAAFLDSNDHREGAEWTGWQQKVSRDQTLQACEGSQQRSQTACAAGRRLTMFS
jgi:hypothetical protein